MWMYLETSIAVILLFQLDRFKQPPSGKGPICRGVFSDFYVKDQPFKINLSDVIKLTD